MATDILIDSPATQGRKRLRGALFKDEVTVKEESLPNLSPPSSAEIGSPVSVSNPCIDPEDQNHGKSIMSDEHSKEIGANSANDLSAIANFISTHAKSLAELYAPSVEAKIYGVAAQRLHGQHPPIFYPEYTKPGGDKYVYSELDFWTSGFFPGCLYALLERRRKFAHAKSLKRKSELSELNLEFACKFWTENLHQNAYLTNTHDIGFMIMPWARRAYDLNHDLRALATINTAASSLFSRYSQKMGCIRSWDRCVTKKYNFQDMDSDYMVIIDNMMNLDLLFYSASKTGNSQMFAAAVQHARTTARTHIRPDGSTTHLIVLDPKTGDIKQRLTNQGYAHESCWTRGQSWAITGFAETYHWTHESEFLDSARRCADYFLNRLPASGIVPWDFDALELSGPGQPPDTSAAMIASYGMILIHQALLAMGQSSNYLESALRIVQAVCAKHVNAPARFVSHEVIVETVRDGAAKEYALGVESGIGESILNGATINNYEFAPRRWADHGLVYADYYFLLVGNKLLELGISPQFLRDE